MAMILRISYLFNPPFLKWVEGSVSGTNITAGYKIGNHRQTKLGDAFALLGHLCAKLI